MSAAESESLARIGRLVSSSLDIEEMFEAIAEPFGTLVPYHRLSVKSYDRGSGTWTVRYATGLEVSGYKAGDQHKSSYLNEQMLETKRPVLLHGDEEPGDPRGVEARLTGLRSALGIPLIVNGQVIGALVARSREESAYSQKHLDLAERIADQVASSVSNAELHALTTNDASERKALAEIGRVVGSTLDIEDLWSRFVEPFRKLLDYDRLVVILYGEDKQTPRPAFVDGIQIPDAEFEKPRLLRSPASDLLKRRKTIVLMDAEQSVSDAGIMGLASFTRGLRSMVAAPIVFNDALVGAIAIKSTTPGIYGEHHAELLERVAELVAGPIANARLHAAVGALAKEEQVLSAIGRSVSASLDFSNSFDQLGESVKELIPYDRFVVMALDPEFTTMTTLFVAGDEISGWEAGSHHPLTDWQNIAQEMTHEGAIFDLDPETVSSSDRMMASLLPGCAMVPLIWDDKPVGTISVRSKISGRFTQYHLEILGRVARQITGAFVNAILAADLEHRVQERTASLQEANADLEAFSYTVSHDLRGPLTMSAHLASRLLESGRDSLSETSRKYIELIAQSSRESADLVTDLLNFARLGNQSLTIQRVDPANIARSAQVEFARLNPGVKWTLQNLPSCDADPGLLRAVFTNLLSNAYKFTASEPEPSVEVGSTEVDGEIAYYIRDNGVGFDMDQSYRVFEVFERLHRPEDYAGTGAGLAIARRIIERHGGRIWVESEVGVGTTFFFTLPGVGA